MSTTLTITEGQIEALAAKLDAMDLTVEEQAALIAVLGGGDHDADGDPSTGGDWNLPTPGEGLRNAFTSGKASEVSGFSSRSVDVSVSVGWSALA